MKKVIDFLEDNKISRNDFLLKFENKYGLLPVILEDKNYDFFCGIYKNIDDKISYVLYNNSDTNNVKDTDSKLDYIYNNFKYKYDFLVFDTNKEYYKYVSENIKE